MEMFLIIALPIVAVISWFAGYLYCRRTPIGKMIIDTTDVNKDIIRFEYFWPLSHVMNKKFVVLKVETKVRRIDSMSYSEE